MPFAKTGNEHEQEALWQRSALDLVQSVKDKTCSIEELIESHLTRVAEKEPIVRAWAFHDADTVRAQARALERLPADLPLLGIPIGIKDIVDTVDMPTAYGSSIYHGHRPASDAEVVIRLRNAGALIMGKTVTTEFAYSHPGATVNPHNENHTPGGSSSGSAAAVAAGMVPLALGSQTGGSTIRPSAYCGIAGFKPTYGAIPTAGMNPLAPSMDTVGIHARSVRDLALVFPVLSGQPPANGAPYASAPRIGYFPGPHANEADTDALRAMDVSRELLRAGGLTVEPIALPTSDFLMLSAANRTIMAYEAALALGSEYKSHRSSMAEVTATLIETGKNTSRVEYEKALELAARCRDALTAALHGTDILMTLSAPGEAPLLRDGTGSSVFNRAWTTMGVPCLTLPFGLGTKAGLPLGVQFVAAQGQDWRLLSLGDRIEKIFKPFNESKR
jgi:Asp-tRNA(Asn)/Glu-tRNA(Gln) amidotransferase A subunit family amidase